jgi:hypothetical protein
MGATGFSDWLGRFGVGSRADARSIPSAGGHYAEFGCPAAAIDSRDLVNARQGIGALHLSLRALSEGLARVASRGHWSREEPGGRRRSPGHQRSLKAIFLSGLFCVLTPALAHANPPQIEHEFVDSVTNSSATLEAVASTQTAPGGYYFEYGTSEAYGSRIPAGNTSLAAGETLATEQIQGLNSDTTYFYRVVFLSGGETATGLKHTFKTQPDTEPLNAMGFPLPDDRAWELVSPPEK